MSNRKFNVNNQRKIRKIYSYFERKWAIPFVMSTLPGGIPTFLGVVKDIEKFSFFYQEVGEPGVKYIKESWAVFFFVCWIFSAIFTFFWYGGSRSESINDNKRGSAYKKVKDTVKMYNKDYYSEFISVIKDKKYSNNVGKAVISINDTSSRLCPVFRLKNNLLHIQDMCAEIFGINKDEISITIIHRPIGETKWEVMQEINASQYEMDIDTLMDIPTSSYRKVLEIKNGTIFYSDKTEAIKNNSYSPNETEINGEIKGSIFCKNISIYSGKKIKEGFIFSLSTRNKKFARPGDDYSENLCKEILNFAVAFIEPEIATYCLNEHILEGK